MIKKLFDANLRVALLFMSLALAAFPARAATVWNGPLTSFTKLDGTDATLAANQDRLTSDVWLTRNSSQGLYNAESESGFTHFDSPVGTEWANGTLANYATLTYTNWNSWAKGVNAGPPSTVGVDAVLHLIPDDVYLSVKFTSWSAGGSGGGFSYLRSTPVPEPSSLLLLATTATAAWIGFNRRTGRTG